MWYPSPILALILDGWGGEDWLKDGQGLKDPCSHMGGGVGAVQDVQELNLNQFYQQIVSVQGACAEARTADLQITRKRWLFH